MFSPESHIDREAAGKTEKEQGLIWGLGIATWGAQMEQQPEKVSPCAGKQGICTRKEWVGGLS